MLQNQVLSADPIHVSRTIRADSGALHTSIKAGKFVPLAVIPLLREDTARGVVEIDISSMPMPKAQLNAVHVVAHAHFVSPLCFARFRDLGIDALNRSYAGVAEPQTGQVIPYFQQIPFDENSEFGSILGIHVTSGTINRDYIESYNVVYNHLLEVRSRHLVLRDLLATTCPPAFWVQSHFGSVVPDFDQAALDATVPFNFVTGQKAPVSGVSRTGGAGAVTGAAAQYAGATTHVSIGAGANQLRVDLGSAGAGVFAELGGITGSFSLASLELAQKTQAFAKLAESYSHLGDAAEGHVKDLLLSGISVPDMSLRTPLSVGRAQTVLGYSQRFASDAANLQASITSGETILRLPINLPVVNTGGYIVVTLQVVPEQVFERARDYMLDVSAPDQLPDFKRDFLDPYTVDRVLNRDVDVEHATPNGIFGYAPLNFRWKRDFVRLGGKFKRQAGDPFDEDRQAIWVNETLNPVLGPDFYLATNLHQKVFADALADAFEVTVHHDLSITGLTQFGRELSEATDANYLQIINDVDTSKPKA